MKHVVIDGLARSGTTLLASILGSQEGVFSSRSIREPFAYHTGEWPISYLKKDILSPGATPIIPIEEFIEQEKKVIFEDFKYNNAGLNKNQWLKIFENIKSYHDLDKAYASIASSAPNTKLSVLRWNQMLYYSRCWVSRPEHYWIAVLRDPRDRAVSRYITHEGVAVENIILESLHYYNQLEKVKNIKNLHIVYYEDLVLDPLKEISGIFNFLHFDLSEIKLGKLSNISDKGQYRNNGWRSKIKHGDHRIGEEYTGIHNTSIGQWKSSAFITPEGEKYLNAFKTLVNRHDFLNRYKNV